MSPSDQRKRAAIAALICGALAFAWTIANFSALYLGWVSSGWPTVPATALDPNFGINRRSMRFTTGFNYGYTVGTRQYTGSNYDSFGPCRTREQLDIFLKHLPGSGFQV